jgi:trehalose synthase
MAPYRITQIEDYEPLIGAEVVHRIRDKAAGLKGLRVANFNSTYYGGGVAETISSLTLLMNSLGLRTEWRVIQGTPDFSPSQRRCTTLFRPEKSISPRSKERFSNK